MIQSLSLSGLLVLDAGDPQIAGVAVQPLAPMEWCRPCLSAGVLSAARACMHRAAQRRRRANERRGPSPVLGPARRGRRSPRVLLVDDNAANLAALDSVLSGVGLELVTAQSGVEAMKRLLMGDFAVILLDINMPTLDGIQTARLIRERERSRDIPIIFITAYQPDQAQILEGYASGAVDYLIKPVNAEVLRSKVRIFIDLFRKKRQIEWQARQLRAVNARLQREIEQREAARARRRRSSAKSGSGWCWPASPTP